MKDKLTSTDFEIILIPMLFGAKQVIEYDGEDYWDIKTHEVHNMHIVPEKKGTLRHL